MNDNLGWFAISGEALLDSLSEGENPDVIYAEVYANSTTEAPASTFTAESVDALAGAERLLASGTVQLRTPEDGTPRMTRPEFTPEARAAWTAMNRALDRHGDSPEYRAAWDRWVAVALPAQPTQDQEGDEEMAESIPTPAQIAREVIANPNVDNAAPKWWHARAQALAAEVLRLTGTPDEQDQGNIEPGNVRIVFEDNASWDAHLAEIEADKKQAWRDGYKAHANGIEFTELARDEAVQIVAEEIELGGDADSIVRALEERGGEEE